MFGRRRHTIARGILGSLTRLVGALGVLLAVPQVVSAQVDVVLNMGESPDPVPAGGVVTYSVTASNNGLTTATGVQFTLEIPAAASYDGFAGTGVSCSGVTIGTAGPATLTCTLPNLAFSGSAAFTVRLRSSASGLLSVSAEVESAEPDVQLDNNDLVETTTVIAGADVALTLAGPGSTASGSTVGYVLSLANAGPNQATSLRVQFPMPAGFSQSGGLPSGCSLAAGTVTCNVAGPIVSGGNLTIGTVSGVVTAAAGSTITASASVALQPGAPAGTAQDPNSDNNTSVANTPITAGTDLRVTKTRSVAAPYIVGNSFNFVLTASYSGESPTGLSLTDVVPVNYTINTGSFVLTQNGWTCQVLAQTVSCTRPAGGAAGVNQSLGTITIPVTIASAGTAVVNSATIAATSPTDVNSSNNTGNDGGATLVVPNANLAISKTGPNPALAVIGQTFNYTLAVSNGGPSPFSGTLVVSDTLPIGLTVSGYTLNGWSCLPVAPVVGPLPIECRRTYTSGSPLASGANAPSIVLSATATVNGSFANTATLTTESPSVPDLSLANNTSTSTVGSSLPGDAADVRVIPTVDLTDVPAGDVLTYTLEVVNDGPQPAASVALTDNFTALINNAVGATGSGYVTHIITPGVVGAGDISCSSASTGSTSRQITCNIVTLPVCTAGVDCPRVDVQVRPGGNGGTRSNTASAISSVTADDDLSNNSASVSANVLARADVSVTQTATPNPIAAGQELVFVVTARNNGPSQALNMTVTADLPLDVVFVSATPSAGTCATTPGANVVTTAGNHTLVCNLGTATNGTQRTVTIRVRPTNATRGTTVSNLATVSTTTTEPTSPGATNNTATAGSAVNDPSVDLLINKTDTVDPLLVGSNTAYTVIVTNAGPSDAENVIVTDSLPAAGLSYQSFTISSGSCGTVPAVDALEGVLQCAVPRVPVGSSVTLSVQMRGLVKGVFTNRARVASDETTFGFENPANNAATQGTTVRTSADMQVVSITPSLATVAVRDTFEWTIQIRNNVGAGLAEADSVRVTDNLPSGMVLTGSPSLTVVSGTATLTSCTGVAGGSSVVCELGTVSNGAVVEISFPVRHLTVPAGGLSSTSATVTTFSLDAVPANNSTSGSTTIAGSTLSGRVFRDFDGDGSADAGDTGISGIAMTLTGTAFDGSAVSRNLTTLADGTFSFADLPEGDYAIGRGAVSEAHLTVGQQVAGDRGGNVATAGQISAIGLGAIDAGTGYGFAFVPQARVGVAKRLLGAPAVQSDGSYLAVVRLVARNYSLEALSAVTLTDPLAGAAPRLGSFVAGGSGASLGAGDYTVQAVPAFVGACTGGTAGSGFTGDVATEVAVIASLAASASCELEFTLRFRPVVPLPGGGYTNQATVAAVGELSGQTPTDQSQTGANADPDGDGNPGDDNVPTTMTPVLVADVTTAVTLPASADAGKPVAGTVLFRNAGPYTAQSVGYTLTLTAGLTGVEFDNLPPGATASYNSGNGQVTLTGMPASLASGAVASGDGINGIGVAYDQAGAATSTVTSGITTSTSQGSNSLPDGGTDTVTGGLIADVTTALHFPATVDAGQTVSGRVTFANNGPSTAAGLSYTLTLSPGLAGVTFDNLPGGASASYVAATGAVTFSGMPATLASGAIASSDGVNGIELSYTQAGSATSDLASTIATSTDQDTNAASDAASATITGDLIADVTTALLFPVSADAGTTVSGTVVFRNAGPSTASGMSYTLTLTTELGGVTFGNLPPGATASYEPATGVVTFTGMPATLTAGGFASADGTTGITLSYIQPGTGLSAIASTIGTSTSQGTNAELDAASLSPGGGLVADVTTLLAFPASVDAGQTVSGTMRYRNNGPSIASGLAYTLTLMPGLSGVSVDNLPSGASASYVSGTGVVTLSGMPATLAVGATASGDGTDPISISYVQPGTATSAVNAAISTTTGQGADLAPDAASAAVGGGLVADIGPTLAFPELVDVGATVTGRVFYRNHGPSTASGLVYQLTLEPGLSGVSFGNLPGGASASYDGGTGEVTFAGMPATLASGAIASGDGVAGIRVSYTQPAAGTSGVSAAMGTSTSQGDNAEPDLASDTVFGLVDVTTAIDFPANADAGAPISGTVRFTNNGPSTASNVTYALTLSPGIASVVFTNLPAGASAAYAAADGQVTFTGMPASLTNGQVASGDGVAGIGVSYTQPGVASSQVSSAIATSTNQGANAAPDAASITITGGLVADLRVTVTNDTTRLDVGQVTVYRIRVTNLGPSDAPAGSRLAGAMAGLESRAIACGPAGANLCSAAPSAAQLSGGFALPALPMGAFYEVRVTAAVTLPGGSVSYTASVDPPASIADPVAANNDASDADPLAVPTIGVARAASEPVARGDGSYDVTFTLTVENLGATRLERVQVTDDLSAFGEPSQGAMPGPGQYAVIAPPVVSDPRNDAVLISVGAGAFTGAGSGSALLQPSASVLPEVAAGVTARAVITYTVRFVPLVSGACLTTTIASATTPDGFAVSDESSDGHQPDPAQAGPTAVDCRGQRIGVAVEAGTVSQTGPKRFRVPFVVRIENLDSVTTATNVQLADDLRETFPTAATITLVGTPSVIGCTGTVLSAASGFDGQAHRELLAGNQGLQPLERCSITFTVEVDFGTGAFPTSPQMNQVTASTAQTPGGLPIATDRSQDGADPDPDGDGNPGNNEDPTPVMLAPAASMAVAKTTPSLNVSVGQPVPYTITATNLVEMGFAGLQVRDVMPAGFQYRRGSATVDGVPLEPVIQGRTLTWTLAFGPTATRTVRLVLLVGAGAQPGKYTNLAQAFDPSNPASLAVSAPAEATVRVIPDPVFACSDVIGRVFDDHNADGRYDRGEPGLANVRLATARGWLVTTDAEGRFHVACAAIPDEERGSNFVMKLDPRTLPSGYAVTTENPRVARVTAGKMTALDFGVAMTRVVRVVLRADDFRPDSLRPDAEWKARLEPMKQDPGRGRRPSVLRLVYAAAEGEEVLGRQRLREAAAQVRSWWSREPWFRMVQIEEVLLTGPATSGAGR